ncbi:MAG TPA: L,D-transpeptidase family protein [Roseiarcus sp.]
MTLRVLFAGALAALPLLVSGALAQTAATPPAATTSPAPSANPTSPAASSPSAAPPAQVEASPTVQAPANQPATTTSASPSNPASPPASSLVSPFMPAGAPTVGTDSAPGASPSTTAPALPVQAAAPPKPKKVAPPRETALSDDPRPTLQPDTFFATAKASERYSAIVDAGGWPTDIAAIGPGTKGPAVAKLRKRLAIEGDLSGAEASGLAWDNGLTAGVKRFQARMGLRQTGIVSGATLKAINIPARVRFKQLASSADRLAGSNFSFENRYVVVNLPSTSVEAVENGRVAHRYVAIVGDPEHPSPEISAHIQVVNLNPTWTVPTSIIRHEIIPRMQRDPGYLTRAKIRILDGQGKEINPKSVNWSTERAVNYTLRQDSGAHNSLGSIRIGMPNKLAVYMHDTPSKGAFGADYRFLSHGCVRVQGVYDYAAWLLEGTPGGPSGGWDKAALQAKIKEGARYDVNLAKAVPVIWVYLTGWSNGEGPANFRDDVYNVDNVGEAQVSAQATPVR